MRLGIDTGPIQKNARYLQRLAAGRGLDIAGVVKGGAARHDIAAALAAGGIRRFYFSGMAELRDMGFIPRENRVLLRIPRVAEVSDIPRAFGTSLQSDMARIEALARAASAAGVKHRILLALDLGDRREGLLPEEIRSFVAALSGRLGKALALEGVLVNFACCTGFLPRPHHFKAISGIARDIEAITGAPLNTLSIGGSVVLDYLLDRVDFGRVTEMRSGEALLLGTITNARKRMPGLDPNAFVFSGEVLEAKTRPIAAGGARGLDAMNKAPRIGPEGLRHRLLTDFGSLHTAVEGLQPLQKGLEIVTASSEYTVVDATARMPRPKTGDRIDFRPDYAALAVALLSPLVEVTALNGFSRSPPRSRTARHTRPLRGQAHTVPLRAGQRWLA